MNVYPGLNVTDCIDELVNGGLTKQHAETIAKATAKLYYKSADSQQLASKNDIQLALKGLENTLIKWMIGLLLGQSAIVLTIVGFMK